MAGRTKRTTKRLVVEREGQAPGAGPALAPAPRTFEPGDWVPVVYEGPGVFSDRVAGVFVNGTRTRLRGDVATRLLGVSGFRAAA